jgi:hypothetical protein
MEFIEVVDGKIVSCFNYEDATDAPSGAVEVPSDQASFDIGYDFIDGQIMHPIVSLDDLRSARDILLGSSDWRDLPSYQGADVSEWGTYRQVLRDITEGYIPTRDSVFPNPPGYTEPETPSDVR